MSESVPWDALRPQLQQMVRDKVSWAVITDSVNTTYGTSLSPQAVRYRVGTPPTRRTMRPSLVTPAYVLPPERASRSRFTDKDVFAAMTRAAQAYGLRRREPLSIKRYEEYRQSLPDEQRALFPTAVQVRRRFGSWNAACEAAWKTSHAPTREYEGLSLEDVVLHVAHWLRWLRENDFGATASASRYRLYYKTHPQAPSAETIRTYGETWGSILRQAAQVEQTHEVLPAVKPVGTKGVRKTPLTTVPLGG